MDKQMNLRAGTGQKLYTRAKELIPGGTQLFSKKPELFLPEKWPAYYSRSAGSTVWDLDGREYTDMSISAVGSCPLGVCDEEVDSAVVDAIRKGNMSTLNAPEEVELAELLCDMHTWADMTRYARTGGEAMVIAIRIARAATDNEKILFCGYHGWHDWYLAANLGDSSSLDNQLLPGLDPVGVPRSLRGSIIPFEYNNQNSFKEQFELHADNLAAVVMEPVRQYIPEPGFLETIRKLSTQANVPLIFDEVTSGFRMTDGGYHLLTGVEPDIAVFAKSLGNGYPMAAIIGRQSIMEAANHTFISSTYWTDRLGPSAAIAMITKFRRENVAEHLVAIGDKIQAGWRSLAHEYNLSIDITGISPLSHWKIDIKDSRLLHTIIVEQMLERGFLTSQSFYTMYSHTSDHVNSYLEALSGVIHTIRPAIDSHELDQFLDGDVAINSFKKLN